MKKFYLGLVSLMLIMLHSCSQDELESTPINEPQAIKVVNIIDGNISTANTRTDDPIMQLWLYNSAPKQRCKNY